MDTDYNVRNEETLNDPAGSLSTGFSGLIITDVGSLDQCFFDCFPVEAGVFSAALANEAARRSFACFPILS